ncbi:hypothetical protein NDS46_29970 (plasmid) [Paenibacillus thiaminolyticus]|uniref:hypothetical protein n=1 Tax=Paenibacillus thiaminolyticus TaxID=49283 RepID=UPI002330412D|nr:hypothetical protein [Paenibacillus thiaminolyticus]WCF11576.1 hypothetical protein NDS46_29970 [Paenibacillus thiaminolyticus]
MTTKFDLFTDKKLESLWNELVDILFEEDPDNGKLHLAEEWYIFKEGTWREDIWKWFDIHHSKGVAWLMDTIES